MNLSVRLDKGSLAFYDLISSTPRSLSLWLFTALLILFFSCNTLSKLLPSGFKCSLFLIICTFEIKIIRIFWSSNRVHSEKRYYDVSNIVNSCYNKFGNWTLFVISYITTSEKLTRPSNNWRSLECWPIEKRNHTDKPLLFLDFCEEIKKFDSPV